MKFSRIRVMTLAMVLAIMLFGSASFAFAGQEEFATAWNWAYTSAFYDENGVSAAVTKLPDPTGQRQGLVLKTDFALWNWGLYCTNGPSLFHFENGRDYTLMIDVYAAPGCYGEASIEICCDNSGVFESPPPCCEEHVCVVGDGQWHRVPVHIRDFCGPDGDYYLLLLDQANAGCWLIGDIRQTSGAGHTSK